MSGEFNTPAGTAGPALGSEDGGHRSTLWHHLFREILPFLCSNFLGSGPEGLWWVYSKFLFLGLQSRGQVSRTLSKPSPKLSTAEGNEPGMGGDLESHLNWRGRGSVPTHLTQPTP